MLACFVLISAFFITLCGTAATQRNETFCRSIPGDRTWPKQVDWHILNNTVNGRLHITVPQASVCHDQPYMNYNETICKSLARDWQLAQTFELHPAEIGSPSIQNQTCDPFTPRSHSCELGHYAAYSIEVLGENDIIAGMNFAKEQNIRLVVKNTGHDYVGRSTGTGALSLWTWNLKTTSINETYTSPWYTGPAMRIGAGMIAGDVYTIAHKAGYQVVGGECGSTGIAGGYTQGGGHSLLSTQFGMAADQVLEWEVITPSGEHLNATPNNNSDLYWALSGGGGGSWGVVLSMTTRLHPENPVAGGTFTFGSKNSTVYWQAVDQFLRSAPSLAGNNNTLFFEIRNDTVDVISMTFPGQSTSSVTSQLAPFFSYLRTLEIFPSTNITQWDSYFDHFSALYGPLPDGVVTATLLSNRLVPAIVINTDEQRRDFISSMRITTTTSDYFYGGFMTNMSYRTDHPQNSVLPAWRTASLVVNLNAFWNFTAPLDRNLALKRELAEIHVPALEAVTPGGGMYLNEMDSSYQGNWKQQLFGVNYDRLRSIKKRYDPTHLFWSPFSVASDELYTDGSGRLCVY